MNQDTDRDQRIAADFVFTPDGPVRKPQPGQRYDYVPSALELAQDEGFDPADYDE